MSYDSRSCGAIQSVGAGTDWGTTCTVQPKNFSNAVRLAFLSPLPTGFFEANSLSVMNGVVVGPASVQI